MKNIFFSSIFLFTITAFSQNIDEDLYRKHSIKQDGETYQFLVIDADEKETKHFDKSKYYFWFKAQKVITTQGGASGQLLDGKFESFYENKQLSSKGNFKKGLKDGEWLYWKKDGSLIRTENWKKGVKSGSQKIYDEKGSVTEETNYKCSGAYTRKTADSLIVSNASGTRKTISTLDENGKVTSTKKIKKGKEVQQEETIQEGELVKPKRSFKLFKKKPIRKDQEPGTGSDMENAEEEPKKGLKLNLRKKEKEDSK